MLKSLYQWLFSWLSAPILPEFRVDVPGPYQLFGIVTHYGNAYHLVYIARNEEVAKEYLEKAAKDYPGKYVWMVQVVDVVRPYWRDRNES